MIYLYVLRTKDGHNNSSVVIGFNSKQDDFFDMTDSVIEHTNLNEVDCYVEIYLLAMSTIEVLNEVANHCENQEEFEGLFTDIFESLKKYKLSKIKI